MSLLGAGSSSLAAPVLTGLEIEMSIDPRSGRVEQTARLEIEASGVAQLDLELSPSMVVERARYAGGSADVRPGSGGARVLVDPPIDGRAKLTLRVTGRPSIDRASLIGPDGFALGGSDRWYPALAHTWARASVVVRAPQDWTVVGPGRPGPRNGEDGVWRWQSDEPLRTLAVAGGPGLELEKDQVLRTTLRIGSSEGGPTAVQVAEALESPLAWFSAVRRPYPFEGVNLVFLRGLTRRVQGSGLVAVPADFPLAGPAEAAGLIAGQWFGEWLAGDGRWIEAFAAWDATLFARQRALGTPADIDALRDAYRAIARRHDVPLTRLTLHTPESIVRGKGSMAPAVIREIVGERDFGLGLRELFSRDPGPRLSLDALRGVLQKHTRVALRRAFEDWFERTGLPRIETELRVIPTNDDQWRVDLTLRQMEGNYLLPVELVLLGPGMQHRERVDVEDETTTLFYILPFEPTRVRIDPLDKLFLRRTE